MNKIYLPSSGKELKVEKCYKCSHKMVNVDRKELKEMDAQFLNLVGIRWSNPKTEESLCVQCEIRKHFEYPVHSPRKKKKRSWSSPASPSSLFGGLGGFGGFGGGGFGGGGASR